MARGSQEAQAGAKSGLAQAGRFQTQAQGNYNALVPSLQAEAMNPQGFGPTDLAAIDTAGQQSFGGSQAGVVGQGGLLAARTRNAGAPMAAIAEGARDASRGLGEAAVGTRVKNAMLKQDQRRAATGQLGDIYGTDVAGSNASLNATAGNVNADSQAKEASWGWAKNVMGPLLGAFGPAAATKAFRG